MENFNWITGAVIPYINFTIFFVVLVWAAKKPMKQMAESRYQKYVDLHAEAKKAFETAEKQNLELTAKLGNLEKEISDLRRVSVESAKHERDVTIQQAEALSAHIADEAKMIAEAEVQAARELIKEEIVSQLKVQVKEKIAKDLDGSKHQEIVGQQFKAIRSMPLSGVNS